MPLDRCRGIRNRTSKACPQASPFVFRDTIHVQPTADAPTVMEDQVSRQVQTEMRKKKKLPASHALKRGRTQKQGESKRTRVERGGPDQRSFTTSEPSFQEADPDHAREEPCRAPNATWRGVKGEWAVTDIVIGDAQPRLPEHQREGARAVSQSPAGSAAEDAGPSGRSEPPYQFPGVPGCQKEVVGACLSWGLPSHHFWTSGPLQ